MAVTILQVAEAHGLKRDEHGRSTMADFEALGLPMLAGCEVCGESLGPWNAYPSMSGYIRCRADIDGVGFETVAAFDGWEGVPVGPDAEDDDGLAGVMS